MAQRGPWWKEWTGVCDKGLGALKLYTNMLSLSFSHIMMKTIHTFHFCTETSGHSTLFICTPGSELWVTRVQSACLSLGHSLIIKKCSFFKETMQALGCALRPLVPGAGLRDTPLIGELLILQGVWVPDFSINASLCIPLSHHKNDIGGQQVIYKSCVLEPC